MQEGDGSDKDGPSDNARLLGFNELDNSLWAGNELERLVVLQGGLHVVVVGVKPLDHLQAGNVDTVLLMATAHGEVLVNGIQLGAGIALGDTLKAHCEQEHELVVAEKKTYAEVLDVAEDLVIEGKVIARDDIDTSRLLDFPVLEAQSLGLGEQLCLRGLASPVYVVSASIPSKPASGRG